MSLTHRRSGGPSGSFVERASLNAENIADLPDEDFNGRNSATPLHASLLDAENVQDDPTANPSTFEEQGCLTRLWYTMFGLKWQDKVFDRDAPMAPQMYNFHNIGLYAHYAGVGVGYGIAGLSLNFCFYFYDGSDNVCANSASLVFVAWGFKIFYAVLTDRWRPWGSRRRVYMQLGWAGSIGCTILLALIGDTCSVEAWLGISILTQAFMMLADVPADGYSVELGQLEKPDERGTILSTGQYIRFLATMFAGLVQAFLVNGPKTNESTCPISLLNCWDWGLSVGQYYQLLAVLFTLCALPICFMREISSDHIPIHTFAEHGTQLWETLKNPTTLFLLFFVSGNGMLAQLTPVTYNYVQYTLIDLTNFQAGVQVIVTYLAVAMGVKIFQVFFLNRNWRTTLYLSVGLSQVMGLFWLLVYWDWMGLMDPWFTIFITVNQALAAGVSQVLFSMAVIELAKPGQEAITYELIVSVANSALTVTVVLATQLLTPLHSVSCHFGPGDDDYDDNSLTPTPSPTAACPNDQVDTTTIHDYKESDGPKHFTYYSLVVLGISLVALLLFTPFLPRTKAECAEWKQLGENGKFIFSPTTTGVLSSLIATVTVSYTIAASIALLNPKTACLEAFGGSGC